MTSPRLEAAAASARTETEAREPRFVVGQQFWSAGKYPKTCTVTDILKTYNGAGVMVRVRYVATHDFMGQTVIDHDVCETTVARNAI